MNIGEFKNVNGQLLGSISTAAIHLPRLGLRPVQSDHSRAPKYEVVLLNSGRRWVQVGAVWEAKSNSTGEFFLQGSVDDPSFPAPLQIACFGNEEEGYRVAWTRNRRRQAGFGQSDGMGGDSMGGRDPMGGGDAFEGNATEDGGLIPGDEPGADAGEASEPQTGRRSRRSQPQEEAAPAF
jgi:uncharacterized protein (DUF736 family)